MRTNELGYNIRSCAAEFKTNRAENGAPVIECYFAVYNTIYPMGGGRFETIAPGAFEGCEARDVRALIDHNSRLVLGRTTAGTLTLTPDERGLYGVIQVNEHDGDATNLYARVQRGDVTQCSFAFDVDAIEYQAQPDGSVLEVIKRVTLYEVSVVTFPAYEETSALARSLRDANRQADHLKRWKQRLKRRLNHGPQSTHETEETQ